MHPRQAQVSVIDIALLRVQKGVPPCMNSGELVYYTANDISNAKFVFLENEDTFHAQPDLKGRDQPSTMPLRKETKPRLSCLFSWRFN